ncbi:aminophospholipid-transporting P-type ATPase [Hyaloraphidium curvatum]|nr:aminophospholipid-transporting P-type ATPase [Hyaloraphidium curvatum]
MAQPPTPTGSANMNPFDDRPGGGPSALSVVPRSPFDLDDDDYDDVEAPYVPISDDNPLLADHGVGVPSAGHVSGAQSSLGRAVANGQGQTGDVEDPNELQDGLEAADYAGGSRSANPATMGEGDGKSDQESRGAERTIYINDPIRNGQAKYLHNGISTAKYNALTFLPKFLFEQFSKYANIFFLFTACIQQIPGVSPLNRYTTVIPLTIVILISAVKEIIEDLKRHQSDAETNARLCKVLRGTQFVDEKWKNLKVGDILRLENLEFFPADLVLLSSSEPDALCYIETSNLDGETNLKVKQGLPETAKLSTALEANQLQGVLRSEAPNSSLYTYEGVLRLSNGRDVALSPTQLLLRGAQQRNTRWTYSIVINTGHETKLLRNASATPIKQTSVERMTNIQIIFLFLILMTMSIVCASGTLVRTLYGTWEADFLNLNSLGQTVNDVGTAWGYFGLNILTYVILFNNLIPISLMVTMEVVKFVHALFINWDLDMYYEETDAPAVARMSSLVEELGQVDYIFSDKTGTLTSNVMEFQMCTIAGRSYATKVPEDKRARVDESGAEQGFYDMKKLVEDSKVGKNAGYIQEFLTLLAVCHTVIPETSDETGEVIYQASSPDEGALVKGAANLGYVFHTRRPRSVTISVEGVDQEYEILNICEFNSTRKRMSAIVRGPDGKIKLYCKGADTVILERLSPGNPFVSVTVANLEDYATDGLRTLCLAVREVSDSEYQAWSAVYDKAATSLSDRQNQLDRAAELIEKDLFLLGATAIEDKLQDGVPDTIHTLQLAGIKIFVLTGDRQETAINIGYSCKLLNEEMSLLICNASNPQDTREFLERKLLAVRGSVSSLGGGPISKRKWWQMGRRARLAEIDVQPLALIIDGRTLDFALTPELELLFLELACLCKAVICCRVSPLQKALVVKLVKRELDSVLLAIGDGANDVSMIQAAHIGIGINGREGLQAARSSDFAISQFRYLRKLLLVHGGWSYNRLSKMILYSFYKNIALYMIQFWFALDNAFSGQTLFESWTLSAYNVILTVFPPVAIGIFDQYLNARMLDRYPQLYKAGQKSIFFNVAVFWGWTLNAVFHSAMMYYLTCLAWGESAVLSSGVVAGLWMLGTGFVYTVDIVTVVLKAALISNYWTKFEVISYVGSILFWVLFFLPLYALVAPLMGMSMELEGMSGVLFGGAVFWFVIILIPVACLIRDYAWKYYQRTYRAKDYHIVQEIQRYNIPDYRPRMEWFRKAVHKVRLIQRLKRNRGYAFSQNESGQATLIRMYDTTKTKAKGL